MPRKKTVPAVQKAQLERISQSLARLSKEVSVIEHLELIEDIASDLEHVTEQLQEISTFNEVIKRSAPKPKAAPLAPPAGAANVPPATTPPRATVTHPV